MASVGGCSLVTIQSVDDQTTIRAVRPGSVIHRSSPSLKSPMESTGNEEQVDHESRLDTSATAYSRRRPASTDALSLTETLTCPNSLETEMNVTAEDRKEFRPVLEVLSLEPPPLGNSGLIRGPTWRTKTIGRLRFPDTTKRSLDALVTNSFTPTQLPAARHIQRFIQANPDTSLPLFLITKEIAEIYGEHGWCLIGKCGLGRITYKIACLTSTNDVTDEELVKDSSRRRIDILCGHIRDRHFEQMLFRCRLCPASYMSQDELSRHWRTHAVGEFACPTCGDILISDVSLRVHRHSNSSKGTRTSKLFRLFPRLGSRPRK